MAGNTNVLALQTASQALPAATADGLPAPSRASKYGDAVSAMSARRQACDEGSYFVATNPTPGTGIVTMQAADAKTFSATAALFAFFNGNPGGGKRVYLDRIKLMLGGTAPTGTLNWDFAIEIDPVSRLPSAGSPTTIVPVNTLFGGPKSNCSVQVATTSLMTVPAISPSGQLVGRVRVPTGVAVAGDEYDILFGEDPPASGRGGTAARAADTGIITVGAAPVVIPPQCWCVIRSAWTTAGLNNTTIEFEVGYIER